MYKTIGDQILFIYKTETIVDRLKMYSGYPVRSMVETDKTPKPEELLITSDELTLIYAECDRAISRIFQIAYKLSKNIEDSLLKNRSVQLNLINEEATAPSGEIDSPPVVSTVVVYGFRLANKLGYNKNLLPMIDAHIENLFISLVMCKWFAITRQLDLLKLETQNTLQLTVEFNNSLTELYKPRLEYYQILPEYTQEVITFDPDTETITNTETGESGYTPPPTGSTAEVLYFVSSSLFPAVGTADIIYVDRTAKLMYSWNGTEYELYNATVGTFEQSFFDTDYVIVEHNLGKYMPTVQMIDSDGDEWDIDTEPIDVNTTICQWIGNKTGILYFS